MSKEITVFRSDKNKIGYISLLATFLFLMLAACGIIFEIFENGLSANPGMLDVVFTVFIAVFLFVVSGFVFVVMLSLSRLKYELGEDALYISMGPWKEKIPYNEITDVKITNLVMSPLSSFRMPGVALFNVYYLDEGRVRMYSTHALYNVVLIKTKNKKYGISPEDEKGFVTALKNRIGLQKEKTPSELKEKNHSGKGINYKKLGDIAEIAVWLTIVVYFAIDVYFYFRLPPVIAIHWNAAGKVDNYASKFVGVFGTFLMAVLVAVFPLIALFFAKKSGKPVEEFKFKYYFIAFLVLCLMLFMDIFLLLWNIGIKINMNVLNLILGLWTVVFLIISFILFNKKESDRE